jgi:hypothetical protein
LKGHEGHFRLEAGALMALMLFADVGNRWLLLYNLGITFFKENYRWTYR